MTKLTVGKLITELSKYNEDIEITIGASLDNGMYAYNASDIFEDVILIDDEFVDDGDLNHLSLEINLNIIK